jgi:uncharacterized membrane protein YbhN (UPF0104 family)
MTDWLAGNRRFLLRLLGTLLAIGLIVLLVEQEGWGEVLAALKQISLARIFLGLLLILISRLFVVSRWYVLLRSGGVRISYSDAAALTFTGLFSSNFLPTTVGGDVVRLAGAMQMGYDRAVCLASIAADRLVGMLGMIFTLPFGLGPAWNSLPGATQSVAFSAFFARVWEFIKRTLQTFSIWLKQPLALLAALGCTWGHMLCTFWTLYLLSDGLGGHAGFWLIAGLWSLAYFVTLVPISINGYGVQELSLTFLFSAVGGLSTAASLTVAVLIRLLYLTASLPGAAYMPIILAAMDADREIDRS